MKRRKVLKNIGAACLGSTLLPACSTTNNMKKATTYKLSLAEWSLNKSIFSKKIDHLDFPKKSKSLGFEAVEYVNQFFMDKAEDTSYLNEMNTRCSDLGMKQLLIMIDREGYLGDTDDDKRIDAVKKHYKWVHAARQLGCHSIRVNAFGKGSAADVRMAAVDGLGRLSEYAAKENINVIVENHGSYSSDGQWLSSVMKEVNMSNCGTLPDFGNFCIEREDGEVWGTPCIKEYDKYKGVREMMPFAKAVSAKAFDFDENGNEPNIDFSRMINIVKEFGYTGYIGIEYEGDSMGEDEGILATKKLLESLA